MTVEAGGTLLVDTSFLGDVLCAEPGVAAATRRWPGAPVDFLTIPAAAPLLANHPDLRAVLLFDKRGKDRGPLGLWRLARRLRRRQYVRVVCSHRSWRTGLLLFLAGIPERIGFDNASAAFLWTRKIHYAEDKHEIQRNLDLFGGGDWVAPRLFLTAAENSRAEALVPSIPFVVLAPGSVWETKRWPEEQYRELVQALSARGVPSVLVGSPEERELCRRVSTPAAVGSQESEGTLADCQTLAGETTLRESAAIIARAQVLVSNDSAPMHLGVATGVPVVALYCSTVPAFGFAPRGTVDQVLEVAGLDCRPCGIHGHRSCPLGHFRCGKDLSVERVFSTVWKQFQT